MKIAEVQQSLSELTTLSPSEVDRHLTSLRESGVTCPVREDSVRVVPDMLGDALLLKAIRETTGEDFCAS